MSFITNKTNDAWCDIPERKIIGSGRKFWISNRFI